MAQADEVDNSYLQVIFLLLLYIVHCMIVLLNHKLQLGINNRIHPSEYVYVLFHKHYSVQS